jgi:hypothetical protein
MSTKEWSDAFWYVVGRQEAEYDITGNDVRDSDEALKFADYYEGLANEFKAERTYRLENMLVAYRDWKKARAEADALGLQDMQPYGQ